VAFTVLEARSQVLGANIFVFIFYLKQVFLGTTASVATGLP